MSPSGSTYTGRAGTCSRTHSRATGRGSGRGRDGDLRAPVGAVHRVRRRQDLAGTWNLPLYKIFCDPFNTAGLIIDKTMHAGFTVEVHDLIEHRKACFNCPEELYDLLVYIGTTGRFVIEHVFAAGISTIRSPRPRPRGCR
jgi:hypothetical protein